MASPAAPSTLTLTPPHLQDLRRTSAASSTLSFRKPKENALFFAPIQTFSLYPLTLQCGRVSANSLVVSALASETEVAEEDQDLEDGGGGGGGGVAVAVATKPKKGKAALPLKSDRVWKYF